MTDKERTSLEIFHISLFLIYDLNWRMVYVIEPLFLCSLIWLRCTLYFWILIDVIFLMLLVYQANEYCCRLCKLRMFVRDKGVLEMKYTWNLALPQFDFCREKSAFFVLWHYWSTLDLSDYSTGSCWCVIHFRLQWLLYWIILVCDPL